MKPVASSAFLMAEFHVGGLGVRAWLRLARSCFLRSSGVGGRPVRPRVSIVPAALPRCLVRRLRLVCAICASRAYALWACR